MRVIRVFPRMTNATPTDELTAINRYPSFWDEADEVKISVTFKHDIPRSEKLAEQWRHVAPVEIGGPAYGDRGGDFVAGRFLKHGYIITSRGCPNSCWFCQAWRNEGHDIRTLPIVEGFNILDNNLLACPDDHIKAVFDMLAKQKTRPQFTGGLESKRLKQWHVDRLAVLKPSVAWFAYDTPDDYDPLYTASVMLREAGIIKSTSHSMCCYVLIGWKGDTFEKAEQRFIETVKLGYFPQAMLYDMGAHFDEAKQTAWKQYARTWASKIIVGSKVKKITRTL